jgi:hypothetical protein
VVGKLVVRQGGKCTCTGREDMFNVTRFVFCSVIVTSTAMVDVIQINRSNRVDIEV